MSALHTDKRTGWRTVNLLSDWGQLQPAWDDFVASHPKGSVFHSSPMVEVFGAAKGHTPLALAAVNDAGELLSLLVAVRVQTLPNMFGSVSSRSVWYAEPLCNDTPESIESLRSLIQEHDRTFQRHALFAEVRPLQPSGPERGGLERCGYEYLDYLNYVLDTTRPVDDMWVRVHGSAQAHVRRCERRGFQFRHLNESGGIDVLYEFLRTTYRHAHVPLADRSLFDAAYRILKPKNMIEIVAVYDGDQPVAADSMLLFKKQVFAWYGGSQRMTGVSPAAYLQWRELVWSHESGFEHYDFGGAGWPKVPYGVRDFKASFGGELVCYGRYRKIYSRWKMALAERAYEMGRTVISPK